MADLINSLKIFTSSGGGSNDGVKTNARNVPLISIGQADTSSDSGFSQWRDAMRMVARLPGGLPPEFRIRLWENLADQYLQQRGLDWARVVAKCKAFENARDEEIADQIQKDLHRTGCTGFSGAKQAVLKRVLVAYAKWNPSVGYCQGFNMIGAMLLQMTGEDELLTLKIFVFLIEGILPQGYFSQGLRGLAIDMAVFREILKLRKPTLHAHLAQLQRGDDNPPLTDVFTMHWFLTLFIHCLPTPSVLRIWDLVLLEGSEVLLRTALVLWAAIETRILCVTSADDFYSVMGVVTREMLEFGLMDPNSLVKCIVSVGQFPFPGLEELRRKHKLLIAQDTPHKSFFLAKRELDNLKRHYASIRQRQRSSSIIHNLENFHKKASSVRPPATPVKKTVVASPKPKPRRTNSANKNILNSKNVSRSNSLNKSANNNNNKVNSRTHVISQQSGGGSAGCERKQVTVPWNMIKKKPKNRPKRTPSTSNYTSSGSSSSSSTELCDSSSSEEEENNAESVWSDAPPPIQKETLEVAQKQKNCNSDSIDSSNNKPAKVINELSKDEKEAPMDLSGNNNTCESHLDESQRQGNNRRTSTDNRPERLAFQIPEINLINTQFPSNPIPIEDTEMPLDEVLGLEVDLDTNSSKPIDTNDSQHFLEEMSRLGKSDSFYENLSHRICQLQFQNLRILTTCNTIPDPVIMPPVDFSPLPSPMSPVPRTPILSSTPPSSKSPLLLPHLNARLILSPSLNHLSLSTSPRGSISGPPSQPGSPQVRSPTVHNPRSDFSDLSRTSSRRTSKSSISSMDDKSLDSPIQGTPSTAKTFESPKTSVPITIESTPGGGISGNQADCNNLPTAGVFSEETNEVATTEIVLRKVTPPRNVSSEAIPPEIMSSEVIISTIVSSEAAPTEIVSNEATPTEIVSSEVTLTEVASGEVTTRDIVSSSKVSTADGASSKVTTREIVTSEVAATEVMSSTFPSGSSMLIDRADRESENGEDNGDSSQPVEDISAVIRENIAILQRLKLKPAFEDDFDDGWSTSSFSESDMECTAVPERLNESNKKSNTTPRRPIRCNSSSGGSGVSSGTTADPPAGRSNLSRTNSTGSTSSKNTTTTSASSTTGSRKASGSNNKSKPKKIVFNPFPTSRKARVRTAKFGLYS